MLCKLQSKKMIWACCGHPKLRTLDEVVDRAPMLGFRAASHPGSSDGGVVELPFLSTGRLEG